MLRTLHTSGTRATQNLGRGESRFCYCSRQYAVLETPESSPKVINIPAQKELWSGTINIVGT